MQRDPANHFREQALPDFKRAVLKVGSSLLAVGGEGLSTRHAFGIAQFIGACHAAGREVILVSSGAVAAGRALLHIQPDARDGLAAKQALAALGQTQMIALWQGLSARPVAQVLLTHDDLRNRRRYLNARATLSELLALGALPVVNENDTVVIDELKLGDNDNLAAYVAALVGADLLLIATDIDGLYTADPNLHPDAAAIDEAQASAPQLLAMAGSHFPRVEEHDVGAAACEFGHVGRGRLPLGAAEGVLHGRHIVEGQDRDQMQARRSRRRRNRALADLIFSKAGQFLRERDVSLGIIFVEGSRILWRFVQHDEFGHWRFSLSD